MLVIIRLHLNSIIPNNYLSHWEALTFEFNFATFINKDLNNQGYGVFTKRNSNIFNPDERISLYLEPIGFKHKPIINSNGAKLYLTNITTIITMQMIMDLYTFSNAVFELFRVNRINRVKS